VQKYYLCHDNSISRVSYNTSVHSQSHQLSFEMCINTNENCSVRPR